jgi:hypothetical protein
MTVVVPIQTGGQKETFLRAECKDLREATVIETVKAMLAQPDKHKIGKQRWTTFGTKRGKRAPVMRPDDERVEELHA